MGSTTDIGYRHSARYVKPLLRVLRRYPGISRKVIEGLDAIDLDEWVPHSVSSAFCERSVDLTGDPDLGLHIAEEAQLADFDVLGFAARSSGNIGEAIDVVNRYILLLREGTHFDLELHGELCRWNLGSNMRFARVINDWTVAMYAVMVRAIASPSLNMTEIHVTHAEPSDTSEYTRILKAPVRFSSDENRLVFPRAWLALPVEGADARLHAVMRRYAGELLERRPKLSRFSDRVRSAVAESLRGRQLATATVAQRLHISERSLRRRLLEEGTSFTAIIDDVRRGLAINYLDQPELGIAEIAFMLGFSQTPAFSRAFKRWTGVTPIEQRKQRRRLRSAS